MITSFLCFKINDKENEKGPDYRLSAKVNGEFKDIGAGWIKETEKGRFISFQLKKPYGEWPGYEMIEVKKEGQPDYPERDPDNEIPF